MKKQLLVLLCIVSTATIAQTISSSELGRYTDGRDGACEISAYDPTSSRVFITNAASDSLDIVDISDPANPALVGGIDITTYGGGINSVAYLGDGFIATAIEANVKQDPGFVVFFDTNGTFVAQVTAGALPDMVTVTPDGDKVLVANEGEPDDDYVVDPQGSVTIIDISGGVSGVTQSDVTTLDFTGAPASIAGGIQNPATSLSVDLEPEYIAVDESSSTAVVACQENNVIIVIDLDTETIEEYIGLGFKDHSVAGNGMDVSNRDNGINIQTWDVLGAYQPDAIDIYTVGGSAYVVSANEGDARDYDGFSSETRIGDLTLDATAFPNASDIQEDSVLGRLKTFTEDVLGDTDGDGDVDVLYSYGARSFSIWDEDGNLVWDSGDDFETYIEANFPDFFNCNDGLASEMDDRSDDKGPEPEAITVGQMGQRFYAFIGLERQGGIMVYNVTDPTNPTFEIFINSYDVANGDMTDIAPEGLIFVPASESHTGTNLLIVSSEVSGTTTIYEIEDLISGVEEATASNGLEVYPNPTSEAITVVLDRGNASSVPFVVLNAMGVEVQNGQFNNNQQQLDLSQLSSGIYYLTIFSETGRVSQKIVKY